MIINPNYGYSVVHPFIVLSGVFTNEECDLISEVGASHPMKDSVVGGTVPINSSIR